MLIIKSSAAMTRVLDTPIDATLKSLLRQRQTQLEEYGGDIGDLASFYIVPPGLSAAAIEVETGFPIMANFVDGRRYGDPAFEPSWEAIEAHSGWFELTFILSDAGEGSVIFVEDCPGVDRQLLDCCRQYAGKADHPS